MFFYATAPFFFLAGDGGILYESTETQAERSLDRAFGEFLSETQQPHHTKVKPIIKMLPSCPRAFSQHFSASLYKINIKSY